MNKVFFSLLVFALIWLPSKTEGQNRDSNAPLNKKVGQMLLVGFRGLDVDIGDAIVRDIKRNHLGGVVLFDYDVPADTSVRNIRSPRQLKSLIDKLQGYAQIPLFITIDQEGGKVVRLKPHHGFERTVSAQYLGTINNADSTRHYARQTAKTLRDLGINTNLAPVLDLNINAENPVIGGIGRSFSADPEIVSKHAKIYINELHEHGIITTLKHFPGHGSSEDDSHKGVVDVTETWQEKELIPYRRLVGQGLADIIMTAHIFNARLDSTYPATLSDEIISGLLRKKIGFEGVVMSDDLQMKAIRTQYELEETIKMSLRAGVDILVFANNSIFDPEIAEKAHTIITKMVKDGIISEDRINRSYHRIMELKREYLIEKE